RALAAAMLAFVAPPAVGQPRSPAQEALAPGRVELSTGLSLDVTRQSDNRGSQTLLNVPLRVGAMASGRFELEGEVLVTFTKDGGISDTGVTGAAHGVYHFATQSSTVPFLLAGAGYGDAVAIGNVAAETGMNVWLLRAGAGVKSFFGRHAALRAEYRFTRYRGSENRFCEACPPRQPSGPVHRTIDDHGVLVGISLWP
ncbi:MAG TPA: outer membrane beta-barrel protein, partial [Vicinamibacteria bacterium]|nr:outer membrane beta-barrel protein [Vicinamibacteria bacterium]